MRRYWVTVHGCIAPPAAPHSGSPSSENPWVCAEVKSRARPMRSWISIHDSGNCRKFILDLLSLASDVCLTLGQPDNEAHNTARAVGSRSWCSGTTGGFCVCRGPPQYTCMLPSSRRTMGMNAFWYGCFATSSSLISIPRPARSRGYAYPSLKRQAPVMAS